VVSAVVDSLLGIGYLETLAKPNVEVVFGEIEPITESGCKCDNGKEYPVEVLICATGFDTSFTPRFPLIGFENKNLHDKWAEESRSYLGLAAPNVPNYMMFLGPNCPIGNGPVVVHGLRIDIQFASATSVSFPGIGLTWSIH
jgi:cation diffusion facilitator CzcD-associated flavoprotein CzcO